MSKWLSVTSDALAVVILKKYNSSVINSVFKCRPLLLKLKFILKIVLLNKCDYFSTRHVSFNASDKVEKTIHLSPSGLNPAFANVLSG